MQSPPPKRLAEKGKWPTPPRTVAGAPAAAPADGPFVNAAPQTAGQYLPPAGSYLLRARLSRGTARVRSVLVECLRLKGDGEDGATWIDSNGDVVATKASYRFLGSGSLALDVVPPSGKYQGIFVDIKNRGETMTLTFTRTVVGACTVEGSGTNYYGDYKMSGHGTRDGGAWDFRLVRTPVEEAQALPPGVYRCPAGCGRTFTHAASAGLHGRSCAGAPPTSEAYTTPVPPPAVAAPTQSAPPPPNPWLADCRAPLELRRYVIDEDWRAVLDYLQEHYVNERHGIPAERIYDGMSLRKCQMLRPGDRGRYAFGASSPGLASRRAAVQGYSNLLSWLENMEETDAFKAAPKTIRRGARLALEDRWYDYEEGDVLDQCQLRVVPSFWGSVDGASSSTTSARRATASASRIVTVLFMQVERGRLRDFVRPDERGVQTYARADGGTTARGLDASGHMVRRENLAHAAAFSRRVNPRVRKAHDDDVLGARRIVELATKRGWLDQVPAAIKALASRGADDGGGPLLLTDASGHDGRSIARPLLQLGDVASKAATDDLARVGVTFDLEAPSDMRAQRLFFVGNVDWNPPGVADIVADVFHRGVALHGAAGDSLLDYIDEQLFARRVPELLFLALGVDIRENAAARRVVRERFRFGTVLRDGALKLQSIVFAERTVLSIADLEPCLWSAWASYWVRLASTYLQADWSATTLRDNQAARDQVYRASGKPSPRRFREKLRQAREVFGEGAAAGGAPRDPAAVSAFLEQVRAGMARLGHADRKDALRDLQNLVTEGRAEDGI